MRVLSVIETLGRGGAERALVTQLKALLDRGHHCEVGVLWPPYTLAAELESQGIKVHKLDVRHRWDIPEGVAKLALLIRKTRADVVHAHLYFAALYSAAAPPAANPPRVVTFHNLGYLTHPAINLLHRARKLLESTIANYRVQRCTAVSKASADHYKTHLGLSSVEVIANAVETEPLEAARQSDRRAVLARFGLSPDVPVLVSPGRLTTEKGHADLLEAMGVLVREGRAPRALIVGDGPSLEKLHHMRRTLGLDEHVTIHPAVAHPELMEVVAASDITVVPSRSEAFGMAAAEAMALDRPVIATRVGGLSEVIEDGVSGLLVRPRDPHALALEIVRLVEDRDTRERLGREGRKRVEAYYKPDYLAGRWEQVYRETMAG